MKAKIKNFNKGERDLCLTFKVVYYDKRKVTPVSCICVPVQICQVTHKYKKEEKKIIKNLSPTATLTKKGKMSLLLPFTYCYTHKRIHVCILFFLETKSLEMSFFFLETKS